MSKLRDLIRQIRACKTAAEERGVIAKECAALRNSFKEQDQSNRHRNVAKLMFIHMLGYPTHFGQMECLKLIAANSYPEKRIGYLGLMLLLDERQEVLMLVTNSLKNDMAHSNQYIVGLALCSLGNICSAEMARDLAPEVEKLMNSTNAYIKKKATLCAIRIARKVPEQIEAFAAQIPLLLKDRNHGVLITAISLAGELCDLVPANIDAFRVHVPALVRVLKNLVLSGFAPEHDVAGITDPFLQVKILQLLRVLGKGNAEASDTMSDILAQVASNTESKKNAGNAILYECVQTIMGIEAIGGLRVLAINILGRFLSNRDNNIRYVALNTLAKVVSVDTQAVQRHRTTIVDCVKDADISIRRRALDLVYALVNEQNVATLAKELLEYLKVADVEFKGDLTNKICALVQRFAPDKQWHIDTLIQVMSQAGNYVKDEVSRSFVILVANASDLQGYAVRALYRALTADRTQQSLVQVGVWCIGEYGDKLVAGTGMLQGEEPLQPTEAQVVELVEGLLKDPTLTAASREFILTALMKLTSRYPSYTAHIRAVVDKHRNSAQLELQQRSCEYIRIFNHENIRSQLLERMPALNEEQYHARIAQHATDGTMSPMFSPKANGNAKAAFKAPSSGPVAAKPPPALMDLLDLDTTPASGPVPAPNKATMDALLDLMGPAPTTIPAAAAPPAASAAAPNFLLDILASTPAAPAAATAVSPIAGLADLSFGSAPATPTAFPSITAFQRGGLMVQFDFTKAAGAPQTSIIKATYSNSSPQPFSEFVLQAAVPKFMQLRMEPASALVVPPNNSGNVTQTLHITNSAHGQKPLAMRLRIQYNVNGTPLTEQGEVTNFPAGL
eukprot:jgi/Chlat1/2728/Chrsp182S02896